MRHAFLEGSIEEPTFIDWPDEMEYLGFITNKDREKYVIQLVKSMYGNVDAALRFFKELKHHIVNELKMNQSDADRVYFS